jgi:hypothetical protein
MNIANSRIGPLGVPAAAIFVLTVALACSKEASSPQQKECSQENVSEFLPQLKISAEADASSITASFMCPEGLGVSLPANSSVSIDNAEITAVDDTYSAKFFNDDPDFEHTFVVKLGDQVYSATFKIPAFEITDIPRSIPRDTPSTLEWSGPKAYHPNCGACKSIILVSQDIIVVHHEARADLSLESNQATFMPDLDFRKGEAGVWISGSGFASFTPLGFGEISLSWRSPSRPVTVEP